MKDQIEERSSQLLRNLSSCEKKAWKKFRLERDAGALLYQLSYQANWEDLSSIWCVQSRKGSTKNFSLNAIRFTK